MSEKGTVGGCLVFSRDDGLAVELSADQSKSLETCAACGNVPYVYVGMSRYHIKCIRKGCESRRSVGHSALSDSLVLWNAMQVRQARRTEQYSGEGGMLPGMTFKEVYDALVEAKSCGVLRGLAHEVRDINAANGWNLPVPGDWKDDYKIPALLGLVHAEVSEALEAFRKDDKENFSEELADILIRVLDLGCGLCIDLDAEVVKKMEKNKGRGYKHGGKRL